MTWLVTLALVYLLLAGVGVVGEGLKWISGGAEGAARIFSFARSPVVGVLLGTLATALVQSSSTVTSVIVGLVAGGLPVAIAVPMIMGANLGTTITNTIVSLGNFGERARFRRSFQAATVHDFFNLYGIVLLLPVEIAFRPLERLGGVMAGWFVGGTVVSVQDLNFVGWATRLGARGIVAPLRTLPDVVGAVATITLGVALIIGSVLYLGKVLRAVLTGRARTLVRDAVGGGPAIGVATGTAATMLVQSSSTTTSLVVPLAGEGLLGIREVYPFTLGANIGTCVTALLAVTAISGGSQVLALQIALVHLLFNVFGVLVFLLVPWIKELPVRSAVWLGRRCEQNRAWALVYLAGVFFVIPGLVFAAEIAFWDGGGAVSTPPVERVASSP